MQLQGQFSKLANNPGNLMTAWWSNTYGGRTARRAAAGTACVFLHAPPQRLIRRAPPQAMSRADS